MDITTNDTNFNKMTDSNKNTFNERDKVFKIYKLLKFEFSLDIRILYNKIISELYQEYDSKYIVNYNHIYNYLELLKDYYRDNFPSTKLLTITDDKLQLEFTNKSQLLTDIRKFDFELKFNYYICKTISKELYTEIRYYMSLLKRSNLLDDKERQITIYNQLWDKFLSPSDESRNITTGEIIERKIEYYVTTYDNVENINKNIINDYIYQIIPSNMRKLKNFNSNLEIPEIFFGLINKTFF